MVIGEFADVYPPELDGVGMVVKNYAQQLSELGEECYYIAPNDPGYEGEHTFKTLLFRGIKMRTEPYHVGLPMIDPAYHLAENRIRFDIVHAHSPFTAGIEALRLAKLRHIPIVTTFHSKYHDDFYGKTHSEVLASFGVNLVVDFYNFCDEVWTVSESSAEVLRQYGYKKEIIVMPNGTDIRTPDPEGIRRVKEQYGLGDLPVFVYVGQMNWKKNLRKVMEAVSLYRKTQPCRLLMIGQGPDAGAIRALSEELNLQDTVVFTGHIGDREQIANMLAAADMMLFPSGYDTSGLVVREAASVGTPAVLLKGSCAAETVTDGINGLLCEDSAESIRDCIERGWPIRARLGEEARRTIPIPWRTVVAQARDRYQYLIDLKKK